ncbi:MAG: acyl-CoA dehydrogenase family protein [Myxococcaceae bacterium]|nr:acyl-CoA dehydrogenase family protein [Myxococcaceae bacterium]
MTTAAAPEGALASFRALVRELVAREVTPHAAAWDRAGAFPRAVLECLGDAGVISACFENVPSGRSAVPLDVARYAVLVEELAHARCFGLSLSVALHVGVYLPLLSRLGTQATRERLLPPALSGRALGAFATTEGEVAGSDLLGLATTLEPRDGGFRLTGEKAYVSSVPGADQVVVLARTAPGRHFANLALVVVDAKAKGVHAERQPLQVMRAAAVGRLRFDAVELDADALLGRRELGLAYFQDHIATERLAGAVWACAVGERCVEEARQHCLARRLGEDTLWGNAAVRQRLGTAQVQLALLRALVEKTVRLAQAQGRVPSLEAAELKAAVAPTMETVIGTCLQLQGAAGFVDGSPLLQLLADFRVFGVAGGSTETMLEQVADLWSRPTPP